MVHPILKVWKPGLHLKDKTKKGMGYAWEGTPYSMCLQKASGGAKHSHDENGQLGLTF